MTEQDEIVKMLARTADDPTMVSVTITGHEYAETEQTFWSDGSVTRRSRTRSGMGSRWGAWEIKE